MKAMRNCDLRSVKKGRSGEFGKAFGITRSTIKSPALGGAAGMVHWIGRLGFELSD